MTDKKMKYKRIMVIISSILIIVTLIPITYSWIIESPYETPMKKLYIQYVKDPPDDNSNRMMVYSPEVTIETRKYISSSETVTVSSVESFSTPNMLPGDSQRFVLRLQNNGTEATSVHLSICGVNCTYEDNYVRVESSALLKYVYLEIKAGSGYAANPHLSVSAPPYKFISLYDLFQDSADGNSALIYNSLNVPITGNNTDYVELECRIWLDTSMTYYKNINITIEKFTISI